MGRAPGITLRQMNSFAGKRLLALARGGTMRTRARKKPSNWPSGSPEGSPAVTSGRRMRPRWNRRFPAAQRMGQIAAGIDREGDSIEYARAHYPGIRFEACDVLEVPRVLGRRFDIIYMLNAFYAFDAQREAL